MCPDVRIQRCIYCNPYTKSNACLRFASIRMLKSIFDELTLYKSVYNDLRLVFCTQTHDTCDTVDQSKKICGRHTITAASCRLLKEHTPLFASSATNRLVRALWLADIFAGRFTAGCFLRLRGLSKYMYYTSDCKYKKTGHVFCICSHWIYFDVFSF